MGSKFMQELQLCYVVSVAVDRSYNLYTLHLWFGVPSLNQVPKVSNVPNCSVEMCKNAFFHHDEISLRLSYSYQKKGNFKIFWNTEKKDKLPAFCYCNLSFVPLDSIDLAMKCLCWFMKVPDLILFQGRWIPIWAMSLRPDVRVMLKKLCGTDS